MNTISIQFTEIHEAYLRKVFASPHGPIKLNRDNPMGRFISATVQWGKEKPAHIENSIDLAIPDSRYRHEEWFYCYLNKEYEKDIKDFVQSYFDITMDMFFAKGYRQRYRQKDIAMAFISEYNLPDTMAIYEMIIKRDFRKRKNIKKIIAKNIINS